MGRVQIATNWQPSGGATNPVTSGLLAEWRYDDGSGQTLTDYSGNGYHMLLGGNVAVGSNDPTWVSGGLQFDGSNDNVQLAANAAFHGRTNYHIIAVGQVNGTDSGFFGKLYDYRLLYTINRYPQFVGYSAGSTAATATLTTALTLNTWYFLEGWRDSAVAGQVGVRLSNNDTLKAVTAIAGTASDTANAVVYGGFDPRWSTSLNGKLAFVAMYNRKLSDAEATQVYQYVQTMMTARSITV